MCPGEHAGIVSISVCAPRLCVCLRVCCGALVRFKASCTEPQSDFSAVKPFSYGQTTIHSLLSPTTLWSITHRSSFHRHFCPSRNNEDGAYCSRWRWHDCRRAGETLIGLSSSSCCVGEHFSQYSFTIKCVRVCMLQLSC